MITDKRYFQVKMRDDATIYGEIRGRGPTLILVYGIACQMNHWVHQIAGLSPYFEVITYDLRGHVRSTAGSPSEQNLIGLVQDLKEILDQLQIERCHFAGHSFGVPILIEFGSQFPEKVQSLALINGFVTNPMKTFLGLSVPHFLFPVLKELHDTDPQGFRYLWQNAVENPLATLLAGLKGGFNLKLTELKDIEIYTRGVANMDISVFFRMFQSLLEYNGLSSLTKISAPTLVIGGEKDQITPLEHQREIARGLPKGDLIEIEYGSHCCQLDFPIFVNLLLKEHINKNHLNLLASQKT